MRTTYLVLSRLIALLVVVQAMAIVWAVSGLFTWIDNGATLDKSVIEGWEDNPPDFEGSFGSFLHFFAIGQGLIPLTGLLLLIVSFFAKVPRGVMLAVIVVVAIVVQILLGMNSQGTPIFGMLHGLGAFVLFGAALAASMAAKKAGSPQEASAPAV
jgi:uncharacterized membrane protein YphA (DoxX/SURF4 family)